MPDASGPPRRLELSVQFERKAPQGTECLYLPPPEIGAALAAMPPETVGHLIDAVFIHNLEISREAQIALAAYELRTAPQRTPRMAHYPHAGAEMLNMLLSSGLDHVAMEALLNPRIGEYPDMVREFLDGPGSHMKDWAMQNSGAGEQAMRWGPAPVIRRTLRKTPDTALPLQALAAE